MGVYEIYMGKGIIVPIKVFVRKFHKEIEEIYKENHDEQEVVEEIVKKYLGDYKVSTLGHDAFQGRHGLVFDMFENTANGKSGKRIANLMGGIDSENGNEDLVDLEKVDDEDKDLPFTSIGCSELIFIGHFENICPTEFSYYLKAPEVIYGMASCLPLIMKHYPILLATDCSSLDEIFNQESCIWTFANDCSCCG